jgi:hypothetical protein
MIHKIITKFKPRRNDPLQYDFIGRPSGRITTAAAFGSPHVHLVAADAPQPAWTLCAQHVSRQQPTDLFGDSGCWICASIARSTGHNVAVEKNGRSVDLREWLATIHHPQAEPPTIEPPPAP